MDQRNIILAIILSVVVLAGSQYFLAPTAPVVTETEGTAGDASLPQASAPAPGAPAAIPGTVATEQSSSISRAEALAKSARIPIRSEKLNGSVSLKGGRIDDLILAQFRETLEPDSPDIVLLSPAEAFNPYYAAFGWASAAPDIAVPNPQTVWEADGAELAPGIPLTLSWDNGEGLIFQRVYALDENYMFTVTQRIVNNSAEAVDLQPYGLLSRTGKPDILGFYILHEGPLGVFGEALKEVDYDDLEDGGNQKETTTGGWIGITDKYWLAALVPDQDKTVDARFVYNGDSGVSKFQTDILYSALNIPSGGSGEITSRLFAGAKEVLLLDEYRDNLGIVNFDLSVDFGWFYFLTKPLFYALHWLKNVTDNFGVAILILTVGVKICFFPLANKSYVSMAKMRKLQPKMVELRERYGDDKQRLNQEMMGLYKKEGANPLSGCLPILVQIPVFFALYKVMFVSIEMRQAPFFGWIKDLSAPDPTSILNGFGLMPWDVPYLGAFNVINIGVWPLLMGLTMYAQQKLNPQPPDPVQAKIFMLMPIVFTFLLASFPAGLVVYWTWNNLLSIAQQAFIMKRAGVPLGNPPAAPTQT